MPLFCSIRHISNVLTNTFSSKQQLKNEAKQRRREKRKERAIQRTDRKRTASGSLVVDESKKSRGEDSTQKQCKVDDGAGLAKATEGGKQKRRKV